VEPQKPADDPNVLTVSQKAESGGKYRTILEALEKVQPGQTIRLLDDATYAENITFTEGARHAGVTLEASGRATLNLPAPLLIQGVSGITLRGLRIRGATADIQTHLVSVTRKCPGTVLEHLDVESKSPTTGCIDLWGLEHADGDTPVTVQDCSLRGGSEGVRVNGFQLAQVRLPQASGGIVIRNNYIADNQRGVLLFGQVHHTQVVQNRVWNSMSGILFSDILPASEAILIANNTVWKSQIAFLLWDEAPYGKNVRVQNNLLLESSGPDMLYIDTGGKPLAMKGPGDPAALRRLWRVDHNWREGKEPTEASLLAKSWIPPGTHDVMKDQLDVLSRDPKSPDFLRPDKDSRLATEGAGKEDPSLPSYVGAVPPEGVPPWDWVRTWRMPTDAQLLTVSKELGDGAKYRSISDALKDAKPWATIRVLDKQDYAERLTIDDKSRHEGLCLEAVKGAALVGSSVEPMLTIVDAPNVRIRGLHFRGDETGRAGSPLLLVRGAVPGLVLDELDLFSPLKARAMGVVLENINVSPTESPALVRRCAIRVGIDGVHVFGKVSGCSGVRVEQNVVQGGNRGIWVGGKVRRVQVTSNRALDCAESGLQVENLAPTSGHILIANNTALRAEACFRFWLDEGANDPQDRQVEFRNNLLFNAALYDMGFVRTLQGQGIPGDLKALSRLWQFGYNARDLSGPDESVRLKPEASDQQFDEPPLVSRTPTDVGFLQPHKDSVLCSKGAGTVDPTLPVYIGAVPPEGVPAWDWDRTWQARMTKTDEK
jgi:hypothetical protein